MASSVDALNAELAQQTELFNKLRVENSDPVALEESRKRLGEIKKELASLKPAGKDAKKNKRLLLKTPKVRPSVHPTSSQLAEPTRSRPWPSRSLMRRARVTMAQARCSAATTSSGS